MFAKRAVALFLIALTIGDIHAGDAVGIPYYDEDFPKTGNVEYLKERCVLDLKTPEGNNGFPTLVWFHGGGLNSGKKYFPAGINSRKIAIAAVNYRLSGREAACPDYLYDAAAAVSWVLKHIREYGGDPAKVYVGGHSAGGYLAVMLALDPVYLEKFGTAPEQLAGFFSISGQMSTHFQILNERRRNAAGTPQLCLDHYAPIALAREAVPPLILMTGDQMLDMPGRAEENRWLAVRLRRIFRNGDCQYLHLEGFNHTTVLQPGVSVINNYIQQRLNPGAKNAKNAVQALRKK